MRRGTQTVAALAAFVVAAIAVTWPLARSASHALAGGLGDPMLGCVLLAWDADRLRHGFHALWNAPYLFPREHTLAYTEHLLGIAVFTAPIEWIAANPILAYNAAYIGSYALAGFGMFLLARELWGRSDAALLAGLAFAVAPYRLAQTPHIQVLIYGWMPIALFALHRYFATADRRWMAVFAASYATLALSNGYYLYFFLVPIAVLAAIEFAWPRVPRRRMLLDFTIAAAAVGLVMAPVAWIYYTLQRDRGFVRSAEELPGLSAQLTDYLRIGGDAWSWHGLLQTGGAERQLFLGFVPYALAMLGVCSLARRNRSEPQAWTRSVAAYSLIALVGVWLSMGPGAGRPYGFLYRVVPGFSGLRVPARLAVVVAVAVAALAGAGFAWLAARMTRNGAIALALACGTLVVVEGQHGGLELTEVESPHAKTWERAAYDWLERSPPGGVLELEITGMNDLHAFTTMYQLNAVRHQHPIVNGYAGWPTLLQELLGDGSGPVHEAGQMADAIRGLRVIGVSYILLHESTFPHAGDAARLGAEIDDARDQVAESHRFGAVRVWRLAPPATARAADDRVSLARADARAIDVRVSTQQDRAPLLVDGDLDTRWMTGVPQAGGEWIELRFKAPIDVARLDLAASPRAIADYPRHLVIESIDGTGSIGTLFDGSVVAPLVEAVARDEHHPTIAIELGGNRSAALRIRQTGRSTSWWSVFEVGVWQRR